MHDLEIKPAARLASIDAYRGLVMFLMMAEVLELKHMARAYPASGFWSFLAHHQTHVEWAGCSLHDLIQPSFSFLVGVAVPFSIASRLAKGQSTQRMLLHAAWRALLLCFLGLGLRWLHSPVAKFTFEDTLAQIGLGYFPLFLLGFTKKRWQWTALVATLVGYWLLFALYPLPAEGFYTLESVGVPPDWSHHYPPGSFESHWNKNSNPAWAFDVWFLNLFPQGKHFLFNGGGYATLSFIPTLGTMILGLLAGAKLKEASAAPTKYWWLTGVCAHLLIAALVIDALHLGPIVKRIWTPTWVLYSGAWCFFILAGLYLVVDHYGWKAWTFPLRVIGANSIVAYVMAELAGGLLVGYGAELAGYPSVADLPAPTRLLLGAGILLLYWLVLYTLYWRKWYVRI